MGVMQQIKGVLTKFINWLPEGASKSNPNDTGNVAKTSPILFEYDVFKINWQKIPTLMEIDEMLKSDTRLKRANHVFASTAVRRGFTVKITSEVSKSIADQAQGIIDELIKRTQLNSKVTPWARSLLKDGELFLNPVIDATTKKITDIKNLPAITMQRNEDITGRFADLKDAFRQVDPVTREILTYFPLYSINHIRWDHESGQLYGNSQYLSCRATWRKLKKVEEELVVRRATRAAPKRFHQVGNKDNPGGWEEVKAYKEMNKLDNPKVALAITDYFGNGLTSVTDLNADAQLDHINDIVHLQEVHMIGTAVPLHIIGFGQNVNRDVVEDQKKQFEEDVQELRDLMEYGDEGTYSGFRSIFDLALVLQGIDPAMIEYNFLWSDSNNDNVNDKVDRVVKLRAAQPNPIISQELALDLLGKDLGLDTQEAIDTEKQNLQKEFDEAKEQQTLEAQTLNPEKPASTPADKTTAQSSGKPTTDSKEPQNILHSDKVIELEKSLADDVRQHFRTVWKRMQKEGIEAKIAKVLRLKPMHDSVTTFVMSDDALSLMNPHAGCNCSACMTDAPKKVQLNNLVEQHVIDSLDEAWNYYDAQDANDKESFTNSLIAAYGAAGELAFDSVSSQASDGIGVEVSFNFVHSGVKRDLDTAAGDRIKGIEDTTKDLLRKQLAEAYENGENVESWIKRIQSVMDIPDWRAEMIARTEIAWAFNRANDAAMEMAGIDKVRYLAIIDNRTCPVCAADHDKVFSRANAPQPPRHPRCRCQLVAEI